MMPPQKADTEPSVHAITIRLPEDLYEDLRRQAYEQRTSINALIVEAVRSKKILHTTPRRALSRRVLPGRVWSSLASSGHAGFRPATPFRPR